MKTSLYIIQLGIMAAVLSSCGKKEEASAVPAAGETISVKTIPLQTSTLTSRIYASGQLTTDDETLLSFKTGGVIKKIYVKEGDKISAGQLLASLDLTEIAAQVSQAQIAFDKAARDHKRAENLYKDSVATLEQLQNAKSGLELAQQQLGAARFNLQYSEIRAAHSGVVVNKLANEGQIAGPGTPVLQVSSKGQADWILRVAVSDREWAQVNINDKAMVKLESIGKTAEGVVSAKAENADPMTGSFSLDIQLKNARGLNAASGLFGKAELFASQTNSGWQIPYDALLDGNAGEGFVFVTNDHKTALKVPVKIAGIQKNTVLISSGLAGYGALIVSGSAYLTDKSAIRTGNH